MYEMPMIKYNIGVDAVGESSSRKNTIRYGKTDWIKTYARRFLVNEMLKNCV
jgi:hypothetical protein